MVSAVVEIGFLICVWSWWAVGTILFLALCYKTALSFAFSLSYLQCYWGWCISPADAWGNHCCWKRAVQRHAKQRSSVNEPPATHTDGNTASVLETRWTGFIEITSKNTELDSLKDRQKENKPFIFMWVVQIWPRSVEVVHWWPHCCSGIRAVAGIMTQIKLPRHSRSALHFTTDCFCGRGCHLS